MLVSVVLLGLLEKKEMLERMVQLVPQAPQALRVWLVSAVSSVCLDNVEREVSLVFQDHLVSLGNRELLVLVGTVDPLDLSDHPV